MVPAPRELSTELVVTMTSRVLNCLVQIKNGNWPDSPSPNPCNKIFIDMVVHNKQDKPLLQVVRNKMFIDMVVCDEQDKPLL